MKIEISFNPNLPEIEQILQRVNNLTPAMRDIAGVLEGATADAFEQQRDPTTHSAWEPLQDKTARRKSRKGYSSQTLIQHGALRRSITTEVEKDQVRIFSPLEYAAAHQLGSADRNIPARPFMGVSPEEVDEMAEMIASYITGR